MSRILGINTRTYSTQRRYGADPDAEELVGTTVSVVLVEGEIGDYAAYAGVGSPEWIARFGDKISFEEACVHFPSGQLDRERYRE